MCSRQVWRPGTPLCPAGHLPRNGGDQQVHRRRGSCNVGDWRKRQGHRISPLAGEMAGRPEAGAKDREHLRT
ncbi:MAG: hypothetical protein EOQ65_01235, partial [Mesorhizobium sp.]